MVPRAWPEVVGQKLKVCVLAEIFWRGRGVQTGRKREEEGEENKIMKFYYSKISLKEKRKFPQQPRPKNSDFSAELRF